MARRRVRNRVIAVTGVVVASLLTAVYVNAQAAPGLPRARPVASVPGSDAVPVAAPGDQTAGHNMTAVPVVAFPAAGAAEVVVPSGGVGAMAEASGLPVSVAGVDGADSPERVQVEWLAGDDVPAGKPAALRVKAVDSSGPVRVRVGYGGFADAYGGGWASRLRLVSAPACSVRTPSNPRCAATWVPTENDLASQTLTAQVDATREGTVLTLEAAPSADGGTYAATPLSPSATWAAGGNSGDFTWSYPMRMPPALGGPSPRVALAYSSQSVDGRTAASNNQPSWVGEGFDYQPGSIMRSYRACNDDGKSGVGDLCWGSDNATLVMSGHAGELIQASTNPDVWRLRNDDGTRVQRFTGAANGDDHAANGDGNGEYWKVTTTDGTQYFFGLNRLPGWTSGKSVTKSAWTVPVFGNNAGEPCNGSTFGASYCSQAYRWNLDYVLDPHGNSMSLWYETRTNSYARNMTDTSVSSYVRGGWLTRIDYGTRQVNGVDSALTSTAPQRVVFTVTDRCITAGATCTSATPTNYPDTPWDLQCTSTSNCRGIYAPTFFTEKKLTSVTTQVANGSTHRDVETWTLNHVFKDSHDGHAKILWLDSIKHEGKVGVATPDRLPDIRFNAVQRSNRVDVDASKNPINRYRIEQIVDEFGGVLTVRYSDPQCAIGSVMAKDANTKLCYPVYWTPYGSSTPVFDWFHKYVVTQVSVADTTAQGAAPLVSTYQYQGNPAWHYDEAEFVPEAHKSWGEWRGYERVRVIQGADGEVQSQTDTIYFRGMHGDKLASGTRTATIPADADFGGGSVNDEPWRQGQVRETITYNGVGNNAPVLSKTLNEPWEHGPTATRTRGGITVNAYATGVKTSVTKTALDGGRSWRTTQTTNTFDYEAGTPNPAGRVMMVDDAGDTATTADDQCTRTSYANNADAWMLTYPVQVETVAVACATTPDRSTQVLADVRTYYDGASAYGTSISKGDVTRTERLAAWNSGNPTYEQVSRARYDENGRIVEAHDALDRKTATSYSPASGGPVTSVTTTNPVGWTATTTVEPAWGSPTAIVDANGRRTDLAYDGLGRLMSVWLPGWEKAAHPENPSTKFGYVGYSSSGPAAVSSAALNTDGGGYLTSWTLYDGLLRPRQTQRPASGGGRIITDTLYDSRGNAIQVNHDYFNAASPGTALYRPDYVPGRTLNEYDNANRVKASIFQVYDEQSRTIGERWRTATTYGGDHLDVTAPAGGTGTSTWFDARGNTIALRQYRGNKPTGAFDETKYTYTSDGKLATLTDPAGNVWRYRYDQQRRMTGQTDPDKGDVTFSYDAADRLLTTTNARGALTRTYDDLDRQTGLYQGAVNPANQLAAWAYEPTMPNGIVLKGQPAGSTRYVGGAGGAAYQTKITEYDAAYRVKAAQVTIPAAEGALAGMYATTTTYNANGSIATSTIPAAGGLPAETLTYTYNDVGLAATLSGQTKYVTGTWYDSFGRIGTLELSDGGKTLTQIWNYEHGTGRLQQHGVYEDATGTVYRDANYTQDAAGNLTSIKDLSEMYGAGPDDTQCYRYDYLRRLSDAWTPEDGNCGTNPSVPALGGPAPYWQSWTYDAIGNQRTQTEHTTAGDTVRTYTYPAARTPQPHTLTKVVTTPPSGGALTDTYTYDASGNTKARNIAGRPGQTLTWDPEGHLAAVTDTSGTTSYLYDADGNRLIAKAPGATTLYLGGQEIRRAGTITTATRYYGDNAARTTSGGLTWTVNDHHDTNELTLTATALAKTQRRTTPFGVVRGPNPAWPTTRGFVGGTRDATGLTHLGAREYDPSAGRFISDDPITDIADPQQINGYAYSNNNPTTRSDPDGLKSYDDEERRYENAPKPSSSGGGGGGTNGGGKGCSGNTPSSRSASCAGAPAATGAGGTPRCNAACVRERLRNDEIRALNGQMHPSMDCFGSGTGMEMRGSIWKNGPCVEDVTMSTEVTEVDLGLVAVPVCNGEIMCGVSFLDGQGGEIAVTATTGSEWSYNFSGEIADSIGGSIGYTRTKSESLSLNKYALPDGIHTNAYAVPQMRVRWTMVTMTVTLDDGSTRSAVGYYMKEIPHSLGVMYSNGPLPKLDPLDAMFG